MKLFSTLILSATLVTPPVHASLDAKIKTAGKKYFGTIIDLNTINDATYGNLASSEFGAVTAEYSFKWNHTEAKRGVFTFANADTITKWASSRGKLIRGHTLIWHQSLPTWLTSINDKPTLTQVLKDHINAVAGRYKGKVYAWDVVNEVFEEDGNFRNSVWYRVLGESFIDLAFQTTRAADPSAKLYINEYNLDYAGPKIDALLALVGRLRSRGVPIDGIGTQAHLAVGKVAGVPAQLQRMADTGLEVAITELDIRIQLVGGSIDGARLSQQRQDYETVVRACMGIPRCVGISAWGISDRYSWVDTTIPGYDSPLMWNDQYGRKDAYVGVEQVLDNGYVPVKSFFVFTSAKMVRQIGLQPPL